MRERICPNCGENVVVNCSDCPVLSDHEWSILEMVEITRLSEDLSKIRVGIEGLTVKIDDIVKRAAEDRAEIAAIRKEIAAFPTTAARNEQQIAHIDARVTKLENAGWGIVGTIGKQLLGVLVLIVLLFGGIMAAKQVGYQFVPSPSSVTAGAK